MLKALFAMAIAEAHRRCELNAHQSPNAHALLHKMHCMAVLQFAVHGRSIGNQLAVMLLKKVHHLIQPASDEKVWYGNLLLDLVAALLQPDGRPIPFRIFLPGIHTIANLVHIDIRIQIVDKTLIDFSQSLAVGIVHGRHQAAALLAEKLAGCSIQRQAVSIFLLCSRL